MKIVKKILLFTALLSLIFFGGKAAGVYAQACADKSNLSERISCYEDELSRLGAQSKTLSNQIAQFDAQIRLTTLKISQTEEKIALLGGRIDQLEGSLDALSTAFSSRAVETYKMARVGDPFLIIVSAPDLTGAISRFHYLQRIQEADRDLLQRLQSAQNTYKTEKTDQEELQAELEKQKANLDRQKSEKAALLAVTRNDEKKYQQLLASARAELAVTLGQGKESFLRNVSEGDTIGRVIPSASGCSSGQHLHFEVHNGNSVQDPNNYLRQISFSYSYGPDQYGYYGTVNPHGSWNWPMNEPIEINQGFGSHGFASAFYPGGFHNGIDMDSGSGTTVKAVRAGKLYGGSYSCGGRYPGALLYARVDQGDGITAWYLHMTPQ
jgi:peptidoglycan hydrolase CwlO-like protein